MPRKHTGNRYQRIPTQERLLQIIDEATLLISEYGFHGFTLRDVANECGITEGGVLYHFKSKDDLLIAVLKHRDEADRMMLCESLGLEKMEGDPFPVGLRDLTLATCRMNVERPEIVRLYMVLQGESLSEDHPAWRYFQDREQWVLNEYRQAAKRDKVENPTAMAIEVLAAMDGLQLRWLRSGRTLDFVGLWKQYIDRVIPESSN